MIPTRSAQGVIVDFYVNDVTQASEQTRSRRAAALLEPMHTDWGRESAMIQGSEEIVVGFYRLLDQSTWAGDRNRRAGSSTLLSRH